MPEGGTLENGIIEQHSGVIQATSTLNEGATFNLHVPIMKRGEMQIEKEIENERVSAGQECFLVAEDDETIRELLCKMLLKAGYGVLSAATART